MRSDDIAAALSEVLWTAERNRRPLQLPDLRVAVPDQAAAYAVQRCTFDQRGAALLGFKLGGTVRPAPGEDRRSYGRLSVAHRVGEGASPVDVGRFMNPCVEPEIALRLGRELAGAGHDRASVAAHLDAVLPALEIADTRYTAFPAELLHNIADNSSSGAVVLGDPVTWREDMDLRAEAVQFFAGAALVGSGVGADVMGDPLLALSWLAGRLAQDGLTLPAGAVVITGGITPSAPALPGQAYRAVFSTIGEVSLRFS
jgi:2-keto-4-pentenoate hydratase